jgi:1-acyl-sn-glycerol-3-phosphate acyltransferase
MLLYLFPLLALGGAVATVLLTPLHPAWGVALFVGYFVALYALFFLTAIVISPFFSKKKVPKKPNRICRFMLVEAYTAALFFMQVHAKVRGMEQLPPRGKTFLVVCNHLSNYDHMLMIVKLRRYPIAFISKPENFRIPVVGRYLWNSGFLSIDRRSARNAISTVNETARRISEGGMCYGVFPEGTRSRTGKLLPFHSGVFLSATKAKAPILVIHMTGTDRVARRAPWRPTRVKMDILSYLDADFTASHTDAEISTHTYELMRDRYPESAK